jgi:tetratricopeptide (TPR) repeat protein
MKLSGSLSREDSRRHARVLLNRLHDSDGDAVVKAPDPATDIADVLHAACELLAERFDSPRLPVEVEALHTLVSQLSWKECIGEREDLLARISFIGWNHSRRMDDYPGLVHWQRRCREAALSQEEIRTYLEIPFSQKSASLNRRFLLDGSVLVATFDLLEHERNRTPDVVGREAGALHHWLISEREEEVLEEGLAQFLAARFALLVVASAHHSGNELEFESWLTRAQTAARNCGEPASLASEIKYGRLMSLYRRRAYREAVSESAPLITQLEQLGMLEKARFTRLVGARSLKELWVVDEALTALADLEARAERVDDAMVAALCCCDLAELLDRQGRGREAKEAVQRALELGRRSGCGWVVANAEGIVAQLLRDHGEMGAAVEAYAMSARSYEESGIEWMAVYTRVLLAETMLLDKRPVEAIQQLLLVLPSIERLQLTQEGTAAVSILRGAARRQQVNADAVQQLSEQLRLMKSSGRL